MRAACVVLVLAVAGAVGCGKDSTLVLPADTVPARGPEAVVQQGPSVRPGQPVAAPAKNEVAVLRCDEAKEFPVIEVRAWTIGEPRPIPEVSYDLYWQTDGGPSITAGTTNADGWHSHALPSGARLHRIYMRPSPFTAPVALELGLPVVAGQLVRISLRLPPAAVIAGVVLDEAGQPVPGAHVAAFHDPTSEIDVQERPVADAKGDTDEQGRFQLGGFPAGPFVLEAGLDNRVAVWRLTGNLAEGQVVEGVEILIEPGHSVFGQVLGLEGAPVANARVVAGKPGRRQQGKPGPVVEVQYVSGRQSVARTDAKGTFVLGAVPDSQEWNLNVEHPHYKKHVGRIEAGQTDVLVQLDGGLRIEGVLSDGLGQPVAQIAVNITDGAEFATSATTGRQGRFLFGGLEAGKSYWILAAPPGFAPLLHGPVPLAANAISGLELRLLPAQRITGRAADADGRPIAGARVAIRRTDLPPGLPEKGLAPVALGQASVLTGAGGDFQFDGLADGDYQLTVTAPDGRTAGAPHVRPGADPLAVTLQ
jgi:protocatechuate 3,4-dioxygenase beta subunit